MMANIREKMSVILSNIGKFTLDSAVRDTLNAVTGRKQVHKNMNEGLKDRSPLSSLDEKKPEDLKIVMEELLAKMENPEEKIDIAKQQNITLADEDTVIGSAVPEKVPDEGIKGSDLLENKRKKIFIRSRL